MPNPSLRESVPFRKAGEQFNPWRRSCGFYPPDIVARQRDLGDGPKRLYERLVRWAGQKGTCWYSYEAMAAKLGKCARQVKSDMAALERYGLVKHERRGKTQTNLYVFLWHPLFDSAEVQHAAPHEPGNTPASEVQPDAHHDGHQEVQVSTSEVQEPARGDVQQAAREFHKGNLVKRIASSSAAPCLGEQPCTRPTDDDSTQKNGLEKPVRECLTAFVRAAQIATPVGQMPVTEIAAGLVKIGANIDDLVSFLKGYAGSWKNPPSTWRHVLVSFRNWIASPRTREEIRYRDFLQQTAERFRDEQIARERVMTTPVNFVDAVRLAALSQVPWPIRARLKRTGDLISPAELLDQVKNWCVCPDCGDQGRVGNALDRDLRLCGCAAGEERRYKVGVDWPDQEIARVHADARSLLVAACYALGMKSTGDALAEADVKDDGAVLEIVLFDRVAITGDDLAFALHRVGWQRRTRIERAGGREPTVRT